MERIKVLLKRYKILQQKIKDVKEEEREIREKIFEELEKNNLEKIEVQIENNQKIICLLYHELKKDRELWKEILKGFYTKIIKRKIGYTADREKIEELVEKGVISPEDFKKLLDEEKKMRIIIL